MRPLHTLFFVPAVGLASALAACGGDTRSGPSSDVVVSIEQPATTCPVTLDETNAHACATDGMVCDVPLMCSTAYQLVRCTCQTGVFSCSDALGVLATGTTLRAFNILQDLAAALEENLTAFR